MSFLRKIFERGAPDAEGIHLYVRCASCGEAISVRANPATDLSPVWDESTDATTGYELHKEMLGTRCNRLIYGHWRFDAARRVLGSEIEGGREITRAEFEALTAGSAN